MMSELKTAIQSIRARRIAGLRGYLRRPVQTQVRRNVKVKQLGIDNTDRIYPDRNDNAQIPVTAEIIFPALQVFLELCIRDIGALLTVSDKDRPTLLPRSLILLSILLCRQYLLVILHDIEVGSRIVLIILIVPSDGIHTAHKGPIYQRELPILPVIYLSQTRHLAAYAIDKIRQGLTPNPDVMCNKLIKFGCFEQRVGKDFDFTATGHYATTLQRNGKTWLGTAKDPVKDQTDFLAQIDYLQVSKLMFPIGGLMKQEVREIANKAGLPSARRKDSQGICFLGKINYNDFVRRFLGEKEGAIIKLETGEELGKHIGYWFHTIGQRKGLGLSGGPWFVVKKDIEENTIYVSRGYGVETQYGNEFRMHDFHFITDNPWKGQEKEIDITFKIRHTPDFTKGKLIQEGEKQFHILSSEKLQGIAPGQFGVIYDEEAKVCVGSGEIIC